MARYRRGRRHKSYAARRYRGGGGFKSIIRRSRGGGGGGGGIMKNVIDGALVGAINTAVPEFFPYQDTLVKTGVGWWRGNQVLQVEAGEEIGTILGSMIGGIFGGGNVATQQGGLL